MLNLCAASAFKVTQWNYGIFAIEKLMKFLLDSRNRSGNFRMVRKSVPALALDQSCSSNCILTSGLNFYYRWGEETVWQRRSQMLHHHSSAAGSWNQNWRHVAKFPRHHCCGRGTWQIQKHLWIQTTCDITTAWFSAAKNFPQWSCHVTLLQWNHWSTQGSEVISQQLCRQFGAVCSSGYCQSYSNFR